MTEFRESLARKAEVLKDLLAEKGFFALLKDEDRDRLRELVTGMLEKLDEIGDETLMVGLMGGTGVGKSTLMNALAGMEISSASHRRPHTEDVLIYVHEDVPLPPSIERTKVPRREHRYSADEARSLVLCDLPDFDSIREEHREKVINFLDTLDVVVWVLSPEKYADGRFFEFLETAPKDKGNYYFVLNKTDIFFDLGQSSSGWDELQKAMAVLRGYIEKVGIREPVLYHLSAEEVVRGKTPSPWNQFPLFRREMFRERDIKEIKKIKTANLDAELEPAFRALEREIEILGGLKGVVEDFGKSNDEEVNRAVEDVIQTASPWVEIIVKKSLPSLTGPRRLLIGPGRAIASAVERFCSFERMDPEEEVKMKEKAVHDVSSALKRHLSARRDHFRSAAYRKLSVSEIPSDLETTVEFDEILLSFEESIRSIFGNKREGEGMLFGGLRPLIFRFRQRFSYTLLFLAFLLVLPGEQALRSFVENPGISSTLTLAILAVSSLFSPRGLAAMVSLIILAFLLGWRFYGHYRRLLEDMEKTWVGGKNKILKEAVTKAFSEQARLCETLSAELESRRTRLLELKEGRIQ